MIGVFDFLCDEFLEMLTTTLNLQNCKVDETFLIESRGLSNVIWVASQSKCACGPTTGGSTSAGKRTGGISSVSQSIHIVLERRRNPDRVRESPCPVADMVALYRPFILT